MQTKLQKIILLTILLIEGLAAVWGGSKLVSSPDGGLIKLSPEVMHGVFDNFLIPGIILRLLGILSLAAFAGVLFKVKTNWILAGMSLFGFIIWFISEIIILREVHALQIIFGLPLFLGIWASLPLIPKSIRFE